jgi:hypothetical protein
VPIVVAENAPTTFDFSMMMDDVAFSAVCDRMDNLLTYQEIEDDPSEGLNGMETSAASDPVEVGVKAEHNTIDLPIGT